MSPDPVPAADTVRWLDERIEDEKRAVEWHERMGTNGSASCHAYAMRAFIEVRTKLQIDGEVS